MSKLRVHNLSISLDGFVAAPRQSLEHPVGEGGGVLHGWIFETRYGRRMIGQEGGTEGLDNQFLARGDVGIGATVMGRNMFGPIRGPWDGGDPAAERWTGWWGAEPPYHHPVFVLTHHARPPLEMEGGTTFHFVTDGIEAALGLAREAAGDSDIRLGGGGEAVRQYLAAGLVDEIHLAIVPVLLGGGERIFEGFDGRGPGAPDGFEKVELAASDSVLHVVLAKKWSA
ncbi:MAG TPA: dihydrofolate reductase family protein [Actinocrinis sp.]|nr:dihydrofolate reductase family protein [Actinocrinis sp.]